MIPLVRGLNERVRVDKGKGKGGNKEEGSASNHPYSKETLSNFGTTSVNSTILPSLKLRTWENRTPLSAGSGKCSVKNLPLQGITVFRIKGRGECSNEFLDARGGEIGKASGVHGNRADGTWEIKRKGRF